MADGADQLAYILHRGDTKDPGPDQFLVFDAYGHEVWQVQGADPEHPYVAPPRRERRRATGATAASTCAALNLNLIAGFGARV